MKNVARVDPKTNQLMYNPTYDELYIPKVLCVCVYICVSWCVCLCVYVCAHAHAYVCVYVRLSVNLCVQ